MRDKPKLQVSKNYDIFEMHEFNRPLHEDPRLLASMQKVGFMPSSPVQCVRNGSGKLKVVRGHHRLSIAKRLSLPVWYVVDDSKVDIFDLEGGRQAWTAPDFLSARAAAGNPHYQRLLEFQKQHRLTLGAAASLLGGESAGSNNKVRQIKDGTFKVGTDLSHASTVVSLTDYCTACGIGFANQTAFVAAISMCVRVPEFDPAVFRHRVKLNGSIMRKRGTKNEYLSEIEALYNYSAKCQRIPLAFEAVKVGKARKETFGKQSVLPPARGKH